MTDKEIIKALECCTSDDCSDCPLRNRVRSRGCARLWSKALDLINRQRAEIERLKGWENLLKAEKHSLIKTKAIKEFAEKLKTKLHIEDDNWNPIVGKEDIEEAVREMVGDES